MADAPTVEPVPTVGDVQDAVGTSLRRRWHDTEFVKIQAHEAPLLRFAVDEKGKTVLLDADYKMHVQRGILYDFGKTLATQTDMLVHRIEQLVPWRKALFLVLCLRERERVFIVADLFVMQ